VGILLEIFASFFSTFGKELFRLAAKRAEPQLPPDGASSKRALWPIYAAAAGCAMIISPAMEGAAYAFTAQSILSACAGMVLLWNIVLAPVLLQEKITLARFGSALVIVIGTMGVVISGNHQRQVMYDSGQWGRILTRGLAVAYDVMLVGWLIILCYLAGKQHRPASRSLIKACLGGSISGGTQFLTKASISLLKCAAEGADTASACASDHPFEHPTLYIVTPLTLLFHAFALLALADALRSCEALVAIAMYEGMVIVSGTISGNLVLGELNGGYTGVAAFFYVTSLLLILVGLVLVAKWPKCLGNGDTELVTFVEGCRTQLPASLGGLRQPLDPAAPPAKPATEGSKLLRT